VRFAYLAVLLVSFAGVVALDRRLGAGVTTARVRGRLLFTIAATLVPFLSFDAVGAARGWFASEPARVVLLVPPGIPLEEPVLLAFLAVLSAALFAALRGERHA
jgi:lycopene cyclase domain-containing protein